jgi:hypothetical protein
MTMRRIGERASAIEIATEALALVQEAMRRLNRIEAALPSRAAKAELAAALTELRVDMDDLRRHLPAAIGGGEALPGMITLKQGGHRNRLYHRKCAALGRRRSG